MKYDIESLKRKMLVKYPFFGSVVVNIEYEENANEEIAATDGEKIYYNPKYLDALSVEEQVFVMAHEVCHIAFNHILRSEGKDKKLWNIATDGVINQLLKRDGLKLVEGAVDIPEAINYDAEQLYELLLEKRNKNNEEKQQTVQVNVKNKQQSKSSKQSDNKADEDSSEEEKQNDVGHDSHSMWKKAVNKSKQEQEDNKSEVEEELENEQEKLEEMGEKDAFKKNQDDKKELMEKLQNEVSKQAAKAATISRGNVRAVNDIGSASPLIDWRYILRETIKYDVDWSYKNAILEDNVLSPTLEEQPMPETEIVIDTSGSINPFLLKNFLRECKNILKHTKLKVGCFDEQFYGFHEIRTEKDIDNMKFEGGGRTNFSAAVHAFSKRAENKIIFTDGYDAMPNMPLDAVWLVFGNQKINPKGGKVIYISNEQLRKLNSRTMGNKPNSR